MAVKTGLSFNENPLKLERIDFIGQCHPFQLDLFFLHSVICLLSIYITCPTLLALYYHGIFGGTTLVGPPCPVLCDRHPSHALPFSVFTESRVICLMVFPAS